MSDFATELQASVNTWASAYIQFKTGHSRERYEAYAFVEDQDDKSFYQQALVGFKAICYLGCGGKTGVISIYKKLESDGTTNGHLFFVDRDTELEPYPYSKEILRTKSYSWESHVCEPDYVGWFLQRRLDPNLSLGHVDFVRDSWINTVKAFGPIYSAHTALCRTAFEIQETLGMDNVDFLSGFEVDGIVVKPGKFAASWYQEKVELAMQKGAAPEEIEKKKAFYESLDVLQTAKGKALFLLLREFVKVVARALSRRIRGDYNSARLWIEAMPCTSPCFEYIREYANSRLASLGCVSKA